MVSWLQLYVLVVSNY